MDGKNDDSLSQNKKKQEWIPLCERERLPFIHLMGITLGTLATTLLFNILYTLFTPLSVKLKLHSITRILILLSGGLIGFFISPFSGNISDRTMFRYGRRRIFMLVGGLIVVLGLLMCMYCIEIGKFLSSKHTLLTQQIVFIVALEITMIAGNFVQTPARSLCSDVCPPSQQVLVSSCVTVYSGLGGIFINLVGALQLYKYTSLSQESFILFVGLGIVAVSLAISIIVTPEESLKEKPPSVNPISSTFSCFKNYPNSLWRIGIAYFISQIAIYQIGIQLTDFMGRTIEKGDNVIDAPKELIDKYQKGVSWAMLCNVMNYGTQFLYSFVHPYCCKLIGMKAIFIITIGLEGVMFMLFFWVKSKIAYLFINIPVGLATVAYLAIPQAIVSLAIPVSSLGQYMGTLYCFCTAGSQTSNFLIGMGGAAIWPNQPGKLVGISCIFSYLSAIAGFWIIIPESNSDSEDDFSKSNLDDEST